MLPTRQQTIIRSLDRQVSESVEKIGKLSSAEEEILETVQEFASGLKRNSNGTIKATLDNLKAIEKFRIALDDALRSGRYGRKVQEFLASFSSTQSIINNYFAASISDFAVNETLLKAIYQSGIDSTVENLLQSGMHTAFREPVIQLLKANVTGNSSIVSLRAELRRQILSNEETSGLLTRHVKRTASDALETFSRTYIQAVSDDLGIDRYIYAGIEIGSTRPFCAARVGKYFTKEEVEKMATLNWSGKNPATNKNTIMVYAGGFSCRHRWLPVTRETYLKYSKKE